MTNGRSSISFRLSAVVTHDHDGPIGRGESSFRVRPERNNGFPSRFYFNDARQSHVHEFANKQIENIHYRPAARQGSLNVIAIRD